MAPTKVCIQMLNIEHVLAKKHNTDPGADLGRCGMTAGTVWKLLRYRENFDGMFDVNRTPKEMHTSVRQLLVTPIADKFHVAAFSLKGYNNHQLVIAFGSDGVAYSVQSYINQYGPTLIILGSIQKVVSAITYLIDHSSDHWTREYCDVYEKLACITRQGSKDSLDRAANVYATAINWSIKRPYALNLRAPWADIVVKLNQDPSW